MWYQNNIFLKSFLKKRTLFLGIVGIIVGAGIVALYKNEDITHVFNGAWFKAMLPAEEVVDLTDKDFAELTRYFTALAEQNGAEHAFGVLKKARLLPAIDVHLVAHVVGDILYRQQGADGMNVCTHDFRNACQHSIVVGLFIEYGPDAIFQVMNSCAKATGGKNSYNLCFHGLGHGVLAYADYDYVVATGICRNIGGAAGERVGGECVGGAVMELVGGGQHDRVAWEEAKQKYLTQSSPLAICSDTYLTNREARNLCYLYITPYLFSLEHVSFARADSDGFERAFAYCRDIPEQDTTSRDLCYRGFGKEFVGYVLGRDIRFGAVEELGPDDLGNVAAWCARANVTEGVLSCVIGAADSLLWGGNNDYRIALAFCAELSGDITAHACVRNLMGNMVYYQLDAKTRTAFCRDVPAALRRDCAQKLL